MSEARCWRAEQAGGPLSGLRVAALGHGPAVREASRLLSSLGGTVETSKVSHDEIDGLLDACGTLSAECEVPAVRTWDSDAVEDWAFSGAMELTGWRSGPALHAPGLAASSARGALLAIELLARIGGRGVTLPDARLLSERAAIAGLRRNAPYSPGGAMRMLRASDGWFGLNLARSSDVELIPAWLRLDSAMPPALWSVLSQEVRKHSVSELAERARDLGLPGGAVPEDAAVDEQLVARGQQAKVWPVVLNGQVMRAVSTGSPNLHQGWQAWNLPPTLVVDLSSLWAGPLCGHLLTLLGMRVVKVESVDRPDGARFGPPAFYDLLHGGQESVAIDFATEQGRATLAGLIEAADVVIEGSRPRALRQLGVNAEAILARSATKCWVGVTAYGRSGPWSNAVGFGDDTAVAAGLVARDPVTGHPAPCGDAIADPLTGIHAAFVAIACRLGGGTWLADMALREVAAATVEAGGEGEVSDNPVVAVAAPTARQAAGQAPMLGAHTDQVLAELGLI